MDNIHVDQPCSPQSAGLGDLLRFWRGQRGFSQLHLALEAGVSQRHVSFVESGRSVPSRAMLISFADALNVPLRERNCLMHVAGYASFYAETSLDDVTLRFVASALDQMMQNHNPHPALLLDRYWSVVKVNASARTLFGSMIDLAAFPTPRHLLELIFDPAGLRPFIEDWETVASGILRRVRRDALGLVVDERLQAVLAKLQSYPGATQLPTTASVDGPILPITFCRGSERLSFFSLMTTVGTPQTVTAQELRLECMFPCEPPPLKQKQTRRR